jgi:multiple sugar transport system substrate-binding protein
MQDALPSAITRRPSGVSRFSRRRALAGIAAGSAALAFGVDSSTRAGFAQGLTGSIRIGYEGSNAVISPYIEATAEVVKSANPGVEIAIEPSAGSNYITQLGLQLFSGRAPDVFLLLGLGAGELATSGFILPLDDYVAAWDAWPEYGSEARFAVTHEDSIWAIPYSLDTNFLYYRKDHFEQTGLPADWQPAHPDDILEAAKVIKAALPAAIPYALYAGANGGNATAGSFLTLINANGGTLTNDEGLWYIDSCPIEQTLAYYERAYQTDAVVPQSVMTDVSPLTTMPQAMSDGSLSLLYEHARNYPRWVDDNPDNEDLIGYALFPRTSEEGGFALGGGGDCWYINAKSGNPDLGWAFIEAFNTVENQVALALDDPHIPARNEAQKDPVFESTPFLSSVVGTAGKLVVAPPEPGFRNLIGVVQNATGLVATGEASPDEAVRRYADELTRTLGENRVISEPCP